MLIRVVRSLSAAGLWLAASGAIAASPIPYEAFNRAISDRLIVPGYTRLAAAAGALASELELACSNRVDADALRVAHAAVLDAWHRIRFVDFGPVEASTGPARVQFWPDARGVGRRQLRRVLKARDPSVTDADALAAKSVALGDLQALEYLLFDTESQISLGEPFRCAYALAVATRQHRLASGLVAAWNGVDGHRALMLRPAGDNPAYFEVTEPAEAIYGGLLTTLEDLAVVRIARPLGKPDGSSRPKRAESWRSRRSLENIVATLSAAEAVVSGPHGVATLLRTAGDSALADEVAKTIGLAMESARSLPGPLFETVQDTDVRAALKRLQDHIARLHALLAGPGSSRTGLRPGFNSSDGDG